VSQGSEQGHEIRPLVLIGGGENAAVVAEAARLSHPNRPLAIVDQRPFNAAALGLSYLGKDEDGLRLARAGTHDFILAVGAKSRNPLRRRLAARYEEAGASFMTVIHPRAIVSASARLGAGTIVLAGACVNHNGIIGKHGLVNTGAIVEHDVILGDHVILGPGVILGGGAHVGADSFLGLGARVRDHLRLGQRVLLGMGAVLVQDAPDDATMVGVPARPWKGLFQDRWTGSDDAGGP
jgi:acetyltransferase EpsM